MNKGVIVAIIVVIAVGIGVISFSQMNENETDEVPSTEIVQNEPKSHTVNLQEKVGVTEVP